MKKLGDLCSARGISLARVLGDAGVSRNAFYTLARKDSVLPRSVRAVAGRLGVKPSDFMDEEDSRVSKIRVLIGRVDRVAGKHPAIDRDNARHMFLLLEEEPVERLRRALLRAQKPDIRR